MAYLVVVLLVAIAGVVVVNYTTPSSSTGAESGNRLSETSLTIAVILFLVATGALLVLS